MEIATKGSAAPPLEPVINCASRGVVFCRTITVRFLGESISMQKPSWKVVRVCSIWDLLELRLQEICSSVLTNPRTGTESPKLGIFVEPF